MRRSLPLYPSTCRVDCGGCVRNRGTSLWILLVLPCNQPTSWGSWAIYLKRTDTGPGIFALHSHARDVFPLQCQGIPVTPDHVISTILYYMDDRTTRTGRHLQEFLSFTGSSRIRCHFSSPNPSPFILEMSSIIWICTILLMHMIILYPSGRM